MGDLSSEFENRAHFVSVASNAMRRVLIDHARARRASKRNGGCEVDIEKIDIAAPESDEQLLALDEALQDLARIDPRAASVVEMSYFRWPHPPTDRRADGTRSQDHRSRLEDGPGLAICPAIGRRIRQCRGPHKLAAFSLGRLIAKTLATQPTARAL